MKRTLYIVQLDAETQTRVRRSVTRFIRVNFPDATKEERKDMIEDAMCGRLADLEENINLNRLGL